MIIAGTFKISLVILLVLIAQLISWTLLRDIILGEWKWKKIRYSIFILGAPLVLTLYFFIIKIFQDLKRTWKDI